MSRRRLSALIPASLLAVAHVPAASAADLAESLRACMAESDEARRLACFDRETAHLATPPSVEEMPAAAQAAEAAQTATTELSPEEKFGLSEAQALEKQKGEEARKPERLTATLTSISQRPHGELVMTLDNGQVWLQKEAVPFWVKVGDTVTIKAAAFGSFLMSTGSGRPIRVTRVQ